MLPYSTLISLDKTAKTPIFLQIAAGLTEHIRRGIIPAGARLPGSRTMADSLGLHRKTVVAAYDELLAQGWLETQNSRGTFVSQKLPEIKPISLKRSVILPATNAQTKAGFPFLADPLLKLPIVKSSNALAFNDGFPDVRIAPWDALSRAYRTALRQGFRKNLLFYGETTGEPSLRAAMTDYLQESRGLPISIENVLITRGTMMAIHLAVQCIVRPGEVVVVGEVSYTSCNLIIKQGGAKLMTVPVDEHGIDVEAIEQLCKKTPVRMVYVTPHHQHPTTVIMPAERRLRLLQLAKTHGFCILEDDYDYDFHYNSNPILPLAAADANRNVVYVGSLSKVFSPALRVGYVVAPAEVIEAMANLRRIIDRQGDNLLEAAVAVLFRDGEMRRHLKKAQKIYHQRRDLFCELLTSELGNVVEFSKPTGGLAVWARFDPTFPLPELARKSRENGLWISDGLHYGSKLNATRLGFAAVNEEEIEKGMRILKGVIEN
ncbi:MAG: PLP-dependent aminotransferase family protein [Phycisphaerae bacterium]|nr:PLP-dependent aminotransferase family protein [Saprospiraceae bacterium]